MAEVESVIRGLEILRLLNRAPDQSLAALAAGAGLPRGTAYRMLFTLEAAGLVERVESSYRVSQRVRTLSHGFDDDWTNEIARPIIRQLGRELVWPITLSEHSSGEALVRETTDDESPLVFDATKVGFRMSLLDTASGRVLLAFSSEPKQRAILDVLDNTATGVSPEARLCGHKFDEIACVIRERGYDLMPVGHRRQTAIAVPVVDDAGEAVAALAIRYFNVAMPHAHAIERFLDPLRVGAARISRELSARQGAIH